MSSYTPLALTKHFTTSPVSNADLNWNEVLEDLPKIARPQPGPVPIHQHPTNPRLHTYSSLQLFNNLILAPNTILPVFSATHATTPLAPPTEAKSRFGFFSSVKPHPQATFSNFHKAFDVLLPQVAAEQSLELPAEKYNAYHIKDAIDYFMFQVNVDYAVSPLLPDFQLPHISHFIAMFLQDAPAEMEYEGSYKVMFRDYLYEAIPEITPLNTLIKHTLVEPSKFLRKGTKTAFDQLLNSQEFDNAKLPDSPLLTCLKFYDLRNPDTAYHKAQDPKFMGINMVDDIIQYTTNLTSLKSEGVNENQTHWFLGRFIKHTLMTSTVDIETITESSLKQLMDQSSLARAITGIELPIAPPVKPLPPSTKPVDLF